MSREIVEQVSREHPDLLRLNLGRTCYQHTLLVVEKLRSFGHDAYLMCKSPGEGQYTPPGFTARTVKGLDGKIYSCSGVSHDAIWCDGKQFDTLASANEHDRTIYKKSSDPGWSFESSDGPQIIASPAWSPIPQHYWRPNNPPLTDVSAPPPQPQPPPPPASKPYPGDPVWDAVGATLFADYAAAGQAPNPQMGRWFGRTIWDATAGDESGQVWTVSDSIKKHRGEWRAALGLPPA